MKSRFLLSKSANAGGTFPLALATPRKYQHTDICLYAWGLALEKATFTKEDILNEFSCSLPTYKRSIAELKCFLTEHWKNCELRYDKKAHRYVLDMVVEKK
jgi:hypothetical protein